jgi:hypothetical protein
MIKRKSLPLAFLVVRGKEGDKPNQILAMSIEPKDVGMSHGELRANDVVDADDEILSVRRFDVKDTALRFGYRCATLLEALQSIEAVCDSTEISGLLEQIYAEGFRAGLECQSSQPKPLLKTS